MAENEFTLPMDYEPAEDNSINAIQATENPEKFLQEGTAPSIVETSFDKVVDSGTASQDWLVDTFAQAATGTYNAPDLWKNRKPTTVEEMGRSLVHGFIDPVKSTFSGIVKVGAYAEAAMEDAEHGLAELIVGRSFPNRNFGRALIHSMNEKERSEAWERTLYENRQGIKSDAWYNMLASAFGSSAPLFWGAVAGVPGKTLAGAEGLMIGASYFSEQSSKLESAGESGAKALPFAVFIGTLGGLIAKTGGETIISDAVQGKFAPAAVSFARGATDNLVKRISKRLLNPVAKRAAKAEAIEELAQEASTIGTEKIQDAVLGTQVNQSTWQEDVQRMLVGLAGGAAVGGLVGEYVYNKNLNQLQKKLEPVFDGDKNKAFEAATAIADAVLNEAVAENAAVKSLEGHVADLNPELAQVLSYVFEDLVNQGFVDFRQATPDEVRQAGLDWANLMSAAAILDSMERNIPLRTHPLFNAIAEIDRILLEGRNPSTGDLLPLDINNAAVRELANNIEDYIEQGRETRQAEEASKLVALREADMRARQQTIQELERAAIAELEKEQAANNQERITELQQQITELQHQMDLLREERSKYIQERAAQGRISIGRAKAQTAPDNKALTKKAVRSGNVDIIKQILQDNGFKTRDLSGTQIKQMAQLNWEMFADKDLGTTKSKFDKNVAMKATEQNVVSGDAVLLRAGYTQGQIDQMDDKTWNRALQAAYREEAEALESVQQQLTPEQAAEIPDDLQYQDTPFDLAAENERLDDIYPEYTGETINIDGKERTVYNSNGERIAKSEPALRNFWNWFGDSKVVDSQGRPLVVYHQTSETFNTFERGRDKAGKYDYETPGGFFFKSSDRNIGIAGNIQMPVYLKAEKTITFDNRQQLQKYWSENIDGYADLLKKYQNVDKDYNARVDNIESDMDKAIDDLENSESYKNATDAQQYQMRSDLMDSFDSTALFDEWKNAANKIAEQMKQLVNDYVSANNIEMVKLENDSGAIGKKTTDSFIVFEPNQIKSTQNRGTFSPDTGNIYYQTAYAGSRVDYDRPSLEAIGSGEGNQAHGWGLYYALDPQIAESYRETFMSDAYDTNWKIDGVPLKEFLGDLYNSETFDYFNNVFNKVQAPTTYEARSNLMTALYDVSRMYSNNYTQGRKSLFSDKVVKNENDLELSHLAEEKRQFVATLHPDDITVDKGQVHEVDIPEMDVFLDEQKTFDEQSEFVKSALDSIDIKNYPNFANAILNGKTGKDIYNSLIIDIDAINERNDVANAKPDKQASQLLEQYGIKGITYDGYQDGRCFVIFNPKDVKVLRKKFDEFGRVLFQNKKTSKSTTGLGTEHRGGYDPMTKAIIFNKTSDLTTLFHESAHYWFDRNLRYYRTGLASPEWKKNWEDVMEALGATPNARGTIPVSVVRSASEKFARSMEAYLREGKYENAAMKWAHQDYANMVKRVYRNIWSTYWGLEDLSPAVQKWFDMFGLKTDDATTAFAEEDQIETDEQMVGAVIAEDATKPDVDAETKAIVADAGAQVVENPATQEIAVVPADPFETGKKARSKLPRSAEAATGVSMDDIIYNRRSMSDAFKAAQQLVNTDPVRAWEILKGGQEMVDGLYAGDIYRALVAKYRAENNPTMLKNVVQAFAGAARRAGRSVKAFDLESPRISFEKTINSLDKIFDTKKNDKRIEKVKNELKEFLHDPSALRVGWEEFKNIVGCK